LPSAEIRQTPFFHLDPDKIETQRWVSWNVPEDWSPQIQLELFLQFKLSFLWINAYIVKPTQPFQQPLRWDILIALFECLDGVGERINTFGMDSFRWKQT
jgi:hypothetical protein